MKMTFEEIRDRLSEAKAAGVIYNVEYKDLADLANRAFEREEDALAGSEPRYDTFKGEEQDLFYNFKLPYSVLHVEGFVARATKKVYRYEWLNARVALAVRWSPVAKLLKEIRPLIVKGRKPRDPATVPSRSNTICQICGRQIEAIDGIIAHHGYERPGTGYQTSSCYGAREKTFNEDRTVLGRFIKEILQVQLASAKKVLHTLTTSQPQVAGPYVPKVDSEGKEMWYQGRRQTVLTWVGPEDAEYAKWHGIAVASTETEIRHLTLELKSQRGRFNTWKPEPIIHGAL